MNDKHSREYALSPVGQGAKWFFALILLLPIAVALMILWNEAAAVNELPGWALGLLIGLGPAILLATAMGVRKPKAELGKDGLRIRVSFINKRWALSELDSDRACLVNLDTRRELRPKWKLWGVAMPGLSSGLFKLYNGEKSHLYITDRQKVVYIPTQSGPVLLSLERPGDFLAALQSLSC
jgi:hypothetical protein